MLQIQGNPTEFGYFLTDLYLPMHIKSRGGGTICIFDRSVSVSYRQPHCYTNCVGEPPLHNHHFRLYLFIYSSNGMNF